MAETCKACDDSKGGEKCDTCDDLQDCITRQEELDDGLGHNQ